MGFEIRGLKPRINPLRICSRKPWGWVCLSFRILDVGPVEGELALNVGISIKKWRDQQAGDMFSSGRKTRTGGCCGGDYDNAGKDGWLMQIVREKE